MSRWKVRSEDVYPAGSNPFGNGFYGYRKTEVILTDGTPATYYGVLVGECTHIVALESDETMYLVRQLRPNAMRLGAKSVPYTLELPGGFVDENVPLVQSALNELQEETGLYAGSMEYVGLLYSDTGTSDERDHIFLGTKLYKVDANTNDRDPTEAHIQIITGKFGDLYSKMQRSKLPVSAQTLAAMAKIAAVL